jgi:hypothetical protein
VFKRAFERSSIFCCFTPGIGTRTDDPAIRRWTALLYHDVIFYEATETQIIVPPLDLGRAILPSWREAAHDNRRRPLAETQKRKARY